VLERETKAKIKTKIKVEARTLNLSLNLNLNLNLSLNLNLNLSLNLSLTLFPYLSYMANNPSTFRRQAIVVIHGMGEQKPNATVRGFVECIVNYLKKNGTTEDDKQADVYDKPDKASGLYETRKLVLTKNDETHRPTTHVYEFYWAHHMRDSKWGHITGWLKRLLFTTPGKIPQRLRKVYFTLWILLLAVAAVYTWFVIQRGFKETAAIVSGITGLAIIGIITRWLSATILSSLGDAGRYMSATPDNIGQRQNIRKEGIAFLRALHESKDYDRIVVAAHSLGTVVAYDLLRLFWVEMSETYDPATKPFEQTGLKGVEAAGTKIVWLPRDKPLSGEDEQLAEDFRVKQQQCWQEQRSAGNQWLITDFITMGSPLAHLDYLLTSSVEEYGNRVKEKEFPVCPPYPDLYKGKATEWLYNRDFKLDALNEEGKPVKLKLLNYSSMFGCTRWTNMYFSSDFVGGPMRRIFGNGIKDVRIEAGKLKDYFPFPFGHTNYWDCPGGMNAQEAIMEALKLNGAAAVSKAEGETGK
jgi:hypothetical protein